MSWSLYRGWRFPETQSPHWLSLSRSLLSIVGAGTRQCLKGNIFRGWKRVWLKLSRRCEAWGCVIVNTFEESCLWHWICCSWNPVHWLRRTMISLIWSDHSTNNGDSPRNYALGRSSRLGRFSLRENKQLSTLLKKVLFEPVQEARSRSSPVFSNFCQTYSWHSARVPPIRYVLSSSWNQSFLCRH